MRLNEKVVLVTGSFTGIGKAIAAACLREGARVLLHGRNAGQGEATLRELEAMGPEKVAMHVEDITLAGAPERMVASALGAFGRLDAIVNNAALVASSNIHTTDLELFRQVLETNTLAPFALIKAALPSLRKQKGCVLNIGSVNAWSGEPNLFAYSVSKGALMTLTRNLGDTLHREDGVRVNQLNVGWVLTEKEIERKKEHGLPEDWYTQLPRVYAPAGRILQPEEIAMAAVYWLADESGPISGQVVELEQHPMIGRNPPKDPSTIPS